MNPYDEALKERARAYLQQNIPSVSAVLGDLTETVVLAMAAFALNEAQRQLDLLQRLQQQRRPR